MRECGRVVLTTCVVVAGCLGIVACGGEDEPGAERPARAAVAAVVKPAAAAERAAANLAGKADGAEAAESFAIDPDVELTKRAPAPGEARKGAATAADDGPKISPGAPSDAQIAAELEQMEAVLEKQEKSGGKAHGITLESDGTATPAPGVPAVVAQVIAGANAIAKFPYVYGGGHGSFVDTAYDCSGSLSYALAAGGLLDRTMTSGDLARTGAPGPGKWITIYANAGHTFMVVDGLRYDTSGRGGPLGTRWNAAPRSTRGFTVRHPPGL
jgi:cell wall-associated NlpC family hydrolase